MMLWFTTSYWVNLVPIDATHSHLLSPATTTQMRLHSCKWRYYSRIIDSLLHFWPLKNIFCIAKYDIFHQRQAQSNNVLTSDGPSLQHRNFIIRTTERSQMLAKKYLVDYDHSWYLLSLFVLDLSRNFDWENCVFADALKMIIPKFFCYKLLGHMRPQIDRMTIWRHLDLLILIS